MPENAAPADPAPLTFEKALEELEALVGRMGETTRAIEDNLRAVVPDATSRELSRLALATYRSYARDVADLMAGVWASPARSAAMFVPRGVETFHRVREH